MVSVQQEVGHKKKNTKTPNPETPPYRSVKLSFLALLTFCKVVKKPESCQLFTKLSTPTKRRKKLTTPAKKVDNRAQKSCHFSLTTYILSDVIRCSFVAVSLRFCCSFNKNATKLQQHRCSFVAVSLKPKLNCTSNVAVSLQFHCGFVAVWLRFRCGCVAVLLRFCCRLYGEIHLVVDIFAKRLHKLTS